MTQYQSVPGREIMKHGVIIVSIQNTFLPWALVKVQHIAQGVVLEFPVSTTTTTTTNATAPISIESADGFPFWASYNLGPLTEFLERAKATRPPFLIIDLAQSWPFTPGQFISRGSSQSKEAKQTKKRLQHLATRVFVPSSSFVSGS